ncbi:MAG TPA: SIR2 family protein, partial [Polyangiaceae bacterium]
MTQAIPTMSPREFATAFALRPNLVGWFLGAGASAASGIPTGYQMIRDFKTEIFARNEKISKRDVDAGDQVWIDRMDQFFRRTSLLPPDNDPNEYAAAFEMVYPQERHRRQYIDDKVRPGTPCYGHKVLAAMMAARKVDCVFTTNFDPLIEDSAVAATQLLPTTEQKRPTVAAIDSGQRAMRCLNESDWPLIAKLHGDYQSVAMKNTWAELEKQDGAMEHVLVEACKRFGLVVVGYSGRDASVMQALTSVLKFPSPFPNGLYWVTRDPEELLPAVKDFLTAAHHAGVDVQIVECATFDELAADVLKNVDLPKVLFDTVDLGRPAPRLTPVSLPTGKAQDFPVLRYSALLIDSLPRVARRVVLAQPLSTPEARKLLKASDCRARVAALGRELAVFGKDEEIVAALASVGGQLAGTIELDPTRDSWALGLLYEALTKALSRRRPLMPRYKRSGHSLLCIGSH